MDLARVEALTAPGGRALLDSLPPYDESAALSLGVALREAGYAPGLVADALTQSRLRARAAEKFGDFAAGMLFTPDGLEQATRLDVAAHHAARFRDAGIGLVHDLGCGIGADALACAALDLRVRACDADAATAAIADVNLRHFEGARARPGRAEDVSAADLAGGGAWLDPARRTPGRTDARGHTRRRSDLDSLSPSWETVCAVAEAAAATGAKLAASFPHSALPAGTEAQWVSRRGEVLELALWWGPLATRPGRGALLLHPDRPPVALGESDAPGDAPVATGPPAQGAYLFDPDKAVLRAGLLAAVTAAVDGAQVAPGAGYVVAEGRADTPAARRYVVTDVLPLHVKTLRSYLRARGVGRLTIKKRGPEIDADRLRSDLRLTGRGAELTVVVTRAPQATHVLVVEPD
ncbi:THUMP-like domain-containing protein [Agilicoccus flavus]|uniref:THUMP-like domain-containing protein n=1 Tax=Agilicoccus flavus TaxID=2775968 RepID=UPI001CF6C952|nr:class I SAM-dependent methyltransferase [Agilicoccus flavus]